MTGIIYLLFVMQLIDRPSNAACFETFSSELVLFTMLRIQSCEHVCEVGPALDEFFLDILSCTVLKWLCRVLLLDLFQVNILLQ